MNQETEAHQIILLQKWVLNRLAYFVLFIFFYFSSAHCQFVLSFLGTTPSIPVLCEWCVCVWVCLCIECLHTTKVDAEVENSHLIKSRSHVNRRIYFRLWLVVTAKTIQMNAMRANKKDKFNWQLTHKRKSAWKLCYNKIHRNGNKHFTKLASPINSTWGLFYSCAFSWNGSLWSSRLTVAFSVMKYFIFHVVFQAIREAERAESNNEKKKREKKRECRLNLNALSFPLCCAIWESEMNEQPKMMELPAKEQTRHMKTNRFYFCHSGLQCSPLLKSFCICMLQYGVWIIEHNRQRNRDDRKEEEKKHEKVGRIPFICMDSVVKKFLATKNTIQWNG